MGRPGPALFELIRDPSTMPNGGGRTAAVQPAVTTRPVAPVAVPRPAPASAQPAAAPPKPRVRLNPEAPAPEAKPAVQAVTSGAAPPSPKASSPGMGSGIKFQWRKPVTVTTSGLLL